MTEVDDSASAHHAWEAPSADPQHEEQNGSKHLHPPWWECTWDIIWIAEVRRSDLIQHALPPRKGLAKSGL
eukprot:1992300-Amphidinium_carterae.1